jgi:hypothetical protein
MAEFDPIYRAPSHELEGPRTKPTYGLSPASLPCPKKLLVFHKILCSCVLSVVACWPRMWPQTSRTLHVPTCPCLCSCHKVLIATVPQDALGQMQHLTYLQNRVDALFQLQQAHSHIFFLLSSDPRTVPLCVFFQMMLPHPMDAARPHGACRQI